MHHFRLFGGLQLAPRSRLRCKNGFLFKGLGPQDRSPDTWRMEDPPSGCKLGSPPFITAMKFGHLEGEGIPRGLTITMVINHLPWDDPPSSWCGRQGLYPIGGENPWFNSPPAWRNIPIIESYPRRSLTGYALMPTISHLEWQQFFQKYENLGFYRSEMISITPQTKKSQGLFEKHWDC